MHSDTIRAIFDLYDRDGDGRLDFQEFALVMRSMDPMLTDGEARIAFHGIDSDRNGSIGFPEFLKWWKDRGK